MPELYGGYGDPVSAMYGGATAPLRFEQEQMNIEEQRALFPVKMEQAKIELSQAKAMEEMQRMWLQRWRNQQAQLPMDPGGQQKSTDEMVEQSAQQLLMQGMMDIRGPYAQQGEKELTASSSLLRELYQSRKERADQTITEMKMIGPQLETIDPDASDAPQRVQAIAKDMIQQFPASASLYGGLVGDIARADPERLKGLTTPEQIERMKRGSQTLLQTAEQERAEMATANASLTAQLGEARLRLDEQREQREAEKAEREKQVGLPSAKPADMEQAKGVISKYGDYNTDPKARRSERSEPGALNSLAEQVFKEQQRLRGLGVKGEEVDRQAYDKVMSDPMNQSAVSRLKPNVGGGGPAPQIRPSGTQRLQGQGAAAETPLVKQLEAQHGPLAETRPTADGRTLGKFQDGKVFDISPQGGGGGAPAQ